jgi:hypothetical protein
MFFDWQNNGVRTGLAIHGVTDPASIAALGHRASAGCIQLSLEASRKLFDLVRDNFEGTVPRFAYDAKTRSTENTGELARDKKGQIVMADGYRALVIIEDVAVAPSTPQLLMSDANDALKVSASLIRSPTVEQGTGAQTVGLVSLMDGGLPRPLHQSRPQQRATRGHSGPIARPRHDRDIREVSRG